jgi:hypothetical protein
VTETTFKVGDRVRPLPGCLYAGTVLSITEVIPGNPTTYELSSDFGSVSRDYWDDELELIDASPEVDGADSVAVSAGLAGSPDDDASGTGTTAEPEAEKRTVYLTGEGATQAIETLTEKVDRLFRGSKLQGFINDLNRKRFERLVSDIELIGSGVATLAREPGHTTTRRMRVNITKNTKGYNHDTTFEIIATDPRTDLQLEMTDGLRLADRLARQAITEAEYTDEHGLPGEDDKPF